MTPRGAVPALLVLAASVSLAGCASSPPPDERRTLTAGNVKLNVVKGQTTQSQILEAFGPPDLVTHKDGRDVWTYDKTSYDYHHQYGYLTVLFAGTGGDRVRSSSRSTMLILYFDDREVVSDYRLSALNY
jgi:hypothetical protein